MKEFTCPVCCADFPLGGDERPGEELYCAYCSAPLRVTRQADADDCEVEEDF